LAQDCINNLPSSRGCEKATLKSFICRHTTARRLLLVIVFSVFITFIFMFFVGGTVGVLAVC